MSLLKKLSGVALSTSMLFSSIPAQAMTVERIAPSPVSYVMDTGHSLSVRFTILYVGPEFSIGYSYGASESSSFICQYATAHSSTAYTNHTIALSDIRAAASRLTVNSGYEISGWTKTASSNPSVNSFAGSGTVACQKGETIYLVAKSTAPVNYNYTLIYDANGGNGAPAANRASTTATSYTYTISKVSPVRDGYTFKGWSESSNASSASYFPGGSIGVTSANPTKTLYAVWEKDPEPVQDVTLIYKDGDNVLKAETKPQGTEIEISSKLTDKEGKIFLGWSTNPDADHADYQPGDKIILGSDTTLYEVWEDDPNYKPDDPEPVEKNSIPSMDKKLVNAEGEEIDESSVKPGDVVNFQLNSNIPDNLFTYVDFESENGALKLVGEYLLTIHDDMDERLSLIDDSLSVKLVRKDGTEVALDTDLSKCEDAENDCDFHVELDLIDLFNKGVINEQDVREATSIVVSYQAKLDESSEPGARFNTAWVTSKEPEFQTDIVEIDVFGINGVKFDSADPDKKLADAQFELWTGEKGAEGSVKVAEATSDEEGYFSFDNLKAGTYYLYETKAPAGYVRSTEPLPVVVNRDNAGDDFIVDKTVGNTTAPSTGGAGTTLFTVGGAALLGSAILIMVARKKREAE